MSKKVIDVSTWQGIIDWDAVKPQIDGAIIRCGYGIKGVDSKFERNASECERLGIPYGVYLYSYAKTEYEAKSEAENILKLIKGRKLSYPVYLDCEQAGTESFAKKACQIVGDIIEANGYFFGVYANLNWWNNYLKGLEKYTKWVAQYNSKCTYSGSYDMWQYSSSGSIKGIDGSVDMNECYKDFAVGSVKTEPSKPSVNTDNAKVTFIKGVQAACGAKVDGIAGTETISKTVTVSRLKNSKHAVVKPVQTYLNHLGYVCGTVDGIYGKKTASAVKEYQREHDCVADGIITAKNRTWKKLLGML